MSQLQRRDSGRPVGEDEEQERERTELATNPTRPTQPTRRGKAIPVLGQTA